MKELDDLVERIESLYTTVFINGRKYPANNPFVMNKINNLLHAGKLKVEDIKYDETKIELRDRETDEPYFYYKALDQISADICNELAEISEEKNQRIHERETGEGNKE